jgi:hypothetical protein
MKFQYDLVKGGAGNSERREEIPCINQCFPAYRLPGYFQNENSLNQID